MVDFLSVNKIELARDNIVYKTHSEVKEFRTPEKK